MIASRYVNWVVYVVLMGGAMLWLAWGKPVAISGLFLTAGLAVGSLYALGGASGHAEGRQGAAADGLFRDVRGKCPLRTLF
jgi:hypothetical protein